MNSIARPMTFGIVSPAFIPVLERLDAGISYLHDRGYQTKEMRNTRARHGYFAGTDQQRIDDLHAAFSDQDIDIIICSRGGWGGLRLLDGIDFDLIASNPKPLIGYSDITTLQLAIWAKTGIASISGPMVAVEMGKGIMPFTEEHFWHYLQSETDYQVDLSITGTKVLCPGTAEGRLLGGCLSMVCGLLGTPFCPDFNQSILFLEDVGEKPYKIDRYLAQLKQAGVFANLNGLVLGEFIDCDSDDSDFSISQIINEYFSEMDYPVVSNFPYGHGDVKISLGIGSDVKLDTANMQFSMSSVIKE